MSNLLGRGGTLDLTGAKVNFFEVISRVEDKTLTPTGRVKKYVQWLCRCVCGTEFITTTKQIRKGRKSCGCKSLCNRFMKSLEGDKLILHKVLSHYINGAKRRNLEWDLTKDYSCGLLLGNCKYCGNGPSRSCSYFKGLSPIKVNGIDRVNNTLGYTENNVVTCCQICNRAKATLTVEEFEQWIQSLIEYKRTNNVEQN